MKTAFFVWFLFPFSLAQAETIVLKPKFEFASSCSPYRKALDPAIQVGMARLENCLNFGFLRKDITERVVQAVNGKKQLPIRVRCEHPPGSASNWYAAAGAGEIWLNPAKMLDPKVFPADQIGSFFVHETGHAARLMMSSEHNESGDMGDYDEVYSFQNYCMRSTRTWSNREMRTPDVVDIEHLQCVRDYQELTPSTYQDPFWDAYRERMSQGFDPCDPSEKSLNQKRADELTRPKRRPR